MYAPPGWCRGHDGCAAIRRKISIFSTRYAVALTTLGIANYRSLRELTVALGPLNLVTGPNGAGKSNLYRALRLLADVARGRLIGSLAAEGGLPSTLWAGPERPSASMRRGDHQVQGTQRRDVVSLRLGFATNDFGYAIDCGLPMLDDSAFGLDPVIKRECVWAGPTLRPSAMLVDRRGAAVRLRGPQGFVHLPGGLQTFDSVIDAAIDPVAAPELARLRDRIRDWRFYDHFRCDRDAPARQTRIGTRTPVLSNDGADLAAAIQTIREIGDVDAFNAAIDDAFAGARVTIDVRDGRFAIRFQQPGLLRPLAVDELSDGTLRHLLWVTALLSPRPPELLVLNEPETSLHPDLLPALGRLISQASQRSQIIVVTHASRLAASLDSVIDLQRIALDKSQGQTIATASMPLDSPWEWPAR